MTDDAKKARREYMKQYYQTHKEQHRRNMEAYWQRKAAKAAASKSEAPTPDTADTDTRKGNND